MENNFNFLSDEQQEYKVYPSLEKAEDNLRYRTMLFEEEKKLAKAKKTNSTVTTSKTKPQPKPKTTFSKKDKNKETLGKTIISDKEKEELRQLVLEAKREEAMDTKHVENIITFSRKKLIEKFMSLYHRGIRLNEKQLQYTKNFFYWHPEAIEAKYIRFLIPATVEIMGYTSAIKYVNELTNVMEDTKYEKPLKEYAMFLTQKAKTIKILDLKKTGMNNSQIGEKLGLSSAEVSMLSEDKSIFIFRDEDVR